MIAQGLATATATLMYLTAPGVQAPTHFHFIAVPAELHAGEFARTSPVSATRSDWYPTVSFGPQQMLMAELDSYTALPRGWDGHEGMPATQEHIETAKQLVDALPAGFPLPRAMLSSDGSVGLYWDDGDTVADVQIEQGGAISMYKRVRSLGNADHFIPALNFADRDGGLFFDCLPELYRPVDLAA